MFTRYRKHSISKRILLTLILCIVLTSVLSAAGMPVFDVENWLYSILSYTQMGTDTANFIKNMEREIELAQKLYQAISDQDLQNAFSTINSYTNRLEKKLESYGVQSEIFSQVNDLQSASLDWSQHLDDPEYFKTVLEEIAILDEQLNNAVAKNTEDVREEAIAAVEESNSTSQSVSIVEESTTALAQKQLNATEKLSMQTPQAQMATNLQNLTDTNKESISALREEAEYYLLKSSLSSIKLEAQKEIANNIPSVTVDLRDPFAI